MYLSALQTEFFHGSKQYEPWSDCYSENSLVWDFIVCNIGYPRTLVDDRAKGQNRDWLEKCFPLDESSVDARCTHTF